MVDNGEQPNSNLERILCFLCCDKVRTFQHSSTVGGAIHLKRVFITRL